MEKLSITDIGVSAVMITVLGICLIHEKASKFFSKCRMKKITEIEEIDGANGAIVFKSGHQHLFTLEKHSKHAVDISNNVVTFLYFGCALENDYYAFRISYKISKRLKEILIPSNLIYEQGLYRLM